MSRQQPTLMDPADPAIQLIQQLKRSPDQIPAYAEELMNKCVKNINDLYKLNYNDVQAMQSGECENGDVTTFMVQNRQSNINMIKRCCAAYVNDRTRRIKALRWKFGGLLPQAVKANLSDAEKEFFNEYCSNLAEFQGSLGVGGVNLILHSAPPKTLFVQVRAVENYGEFETSDGTVVILKKNSIHSLPRVDCEMLIKHGILELAH